MGGGGREEEGSEAGSELHGGTASVFIVGVASRGEGRDSEWAWPSRSHVVHGRLEPIEFKMKGKGGQRRVGMVAVKELPIRHRDRREDSG